MTIFPILILFIRHMIQSPMASLLKRCLLVVLVAGLLLVPGHWGRAATIYIDGCATGPQDGSQVNPYHTLTTAVANSVTGDDFIMKGGNYPEDVSVMALHNIGKQDGIPVIGKGIYNVGWQDVTVPITNCASSTTSARVYYPARAPGQDTAIDCRGPYPAVVFVHGNRDEEWELCDWSNPGDKHNDYLQAEGIMKQLAATGIVAISANWFDVENCDSGYPYVQAYNVIMGAVDYLRNSWSGIVDPHRIGLSGHSNGGGGALLAAHKFEEIGDPNLTIGGLGLIASGCAYGSAQDPCFVDDVDTSPDHPPHIFSLSNTPMLVIHGTKERLGEVQFQPLEIYCQAEGTEAAPKHLIVLKGANHFGYTDGICLDPVTGNRDYPSEVGGVTGLGAHKRQQLAAGSYLQAFFSHYLSGKANALNYLLQVDRQQCGHPEDWRQCRNELVFSPTSNEIDDGDTGTSFTGNWETYTGSDAHDGDSLYASGTGSTYTFQWSFSGEIKDLDIKQQWTSHSDRCTNTQIEISDSTGLYDTLYVNQQENGGIWNYLGTYQFENFAMLKIISQNGCYVSADAVEFSTYISPPPEWLCEPAHTFKELKSVMNVEVNVCSCTDR